MALLSILHYPNERLHLKALPVTNFNQELKELVADMKETMYANNGAGLAATQVDVQQRVFIMDVSRSNEPPELMVLVNPKILDKGGATKSEEGCLSVPGIFETVTRFEWVKIEYQDVDGKPHQLECDGIKAICIQHETDHLDGKVFVEYLSGLKQNFIKKKMKKLFRNG